MNVAKRNHSSIGDVLNQLRDESGQLRTIEQLEQAIARSGLSADKDVIVYCTIGNRASLVNGGTTTCTYDKADRMIVVRGPSSKPGAVRGCASLANIAHLHSRDQRSDGERTTTG